MTEIEWTTCTEPKLMLDLAWGKGRKRKFLLFVCACCRQAWPLLTDERCRRAVEVLERYADGEATQEELASARAEMQSCHGYRNSTEGALILGIYNAFASVWTAACYTAVEAKEPERSAQPHLARDIVGNPFRPAAVERS